MLNSMQLAVMGSRAPSWYGARWGKCSVNSCPNVAFTITSGLACGIDGVAHHAALSAKGETIAVLGNGLFSLYPRRHHILAEQLIASEGAIVSEFSLSTSPPTG